MALEVSATEFNDTTQTVVDVLHLYDTLLDTNNGSVIYLLIARPLSYVAAKLTALFKSFIHDTSLQVLASSQATDTLALDLIAANFMLLRKTLKYASGFVTLILREPTAYMPSGVLFYIADKTFQTPSRIYIAPSESGAQSTASDVTQVVAYPMADGKYSAYIPVTCTDTGYVLISAGATVNIVWNMPLLVQALLMSPISGGAGALTDALLVSRIRNTVIMLSHATPRVIQRRLQSAPYPVLGCYAVGGLELLRASHNYLGISRGGMIDVYIKTQNQLQVIDVLVVCTADGVLNLPAQHAAGVLDVLSVRGPDGSAIAGAGVRYTTHLLFMSDSLARLSAVQAILINGTLFAAGKQYIVTMRKMPGVYLNQRYIEDPGLAFVGLSILLHSAIPVRLAIKIGLDSLLAIDLITRAQMRLAIADIINRSDVGQAVINISDIDKLFSARFAGSTLRAPCAITAHIPTRLGTDYTFTSLSCVLDITLRLGLYTWDLSAYYFCCTPDNIEFALI